MSSEITVDNTVLSQALANAGKDERLRNAILDALRQAESHSADPASFRDHVRWPLILALLGEAKTHRVVMENGLIFEVGAESRIEQALLLSSVAHPDHVWEPQTTRLLVALAEGVSHIIVGGAYIGDQVLFLARAGSVQTPPTVIHAFEPMAHSFNRLLQNLKLNNISNVVPHQLGLWDGSKVRLSVEGHLGLASSNPVANESSTPGEVIDSVSIDDYVKKEQLPSLGLIMLDTEGGEEKALLGAADTIDRHKPNIVFEIHRNFVDWTPGLEKTSIVEFLKSRGYTVFAIRDFHNNYPMKDHPIEIVPVDRVYLEGPPHGFNALAITNLTLIERLGLRVIENVSPKLLLHKDPALHHPIF